MTKSSIIFFVIISCIQACNKFDAHIERKKKCIPLEISCCGCIGSSYLTNISTDKVITFVVRITYKGDNPFTSTRRIELFPGEEKRLGNNYDYRKTKEGGQCIEKKIYEQYYDYEIVGQIITKFSN